MDSVKATAEISGDSIGDVYSFTCARVKVYMFVGWSLARSGCCFDPREGDVVIIKLRKHSPTTNKSISGRSLAGCGWLSDGRMGWSMDCIINHPATNADWRSQDRTAMSIGASEYFVCEWVLRDHSPRYID